MDYIISALRSVHGSVSFSQYRCLCVIDRQLLSQSKTVLCVIMQTCLNFEQKCITLNFILFTHTCVILSAIFWGHQLLPWFFCSTCYRPMHIYGTYHLQSHNHVNSIIPQWSAGSSHPCWTNSPFVNTSTAHSSLRRIKLRQTILLLRLTNCVELFA